MIWRIQTREQFVSMCLSDYIENRLGRVVCKKEVKPECTLIREDGNIFNLVGIVSHTLKEDGMEEQAEEMCQGITAGICHSYEDALMIIADYVEMRSSEQEEEININFS